MMLPVSGRESSAVLDNQSLSAIFLTCVDSRSFAAAGRKLNLSRSSVGKAIARLELDLGVRLFHRSSRVQALTEDGQIYLDHARRAQAELEAARQIFASGRQVPNGILRVALPATLGRHCVGPLLLDMAKDHPDLRLALSLSDRPVDLVDGGFDLSVRVGAALDSAGIMQRKIGVQVMGLFAAPAYIECRGMPAGAADLERHDMIVYSRGRTLSWRMPDDDMDGAMLTGDAKAQVDDLDLLADAARRGFGIASLPCWLAGASVRAGTLIELASSQRRAFDITALWPHTPHLPVRTRAAIEYLAARLPALLSDLTGDVDDLAGHARDRRLPAS
jgi:DNA-binding transcriptional LysR family regulator